LFDGSGQPSRLVISCELDLDHIKVLITHTDDVDVDGVGPPIDGLTGCEVFLFLGIKVSSPSSTRNFLLQ